MTLLPIVDELSFFGSWTDMLRFLRACAGARRRIKEKGLPRFDPSDERVFFAVEGGVKGPCVDLFVVGL